MAYHISQLLNSILPEQSRWKRHLLEQWPLIIGKLHAHVTIENIQDDALTLGVYDSCWLQELHMLSPLLIKQINETLDQPRIKQVRFKQIGHVVIKKSNIKKKEATPSIIVQLNVAEKDALSHIADPDLKTALTSYLMRCHRERT